MISKDSLRESSLLNQLTITHLTKTTTQESRIGLEEKNYRVLKTNAGHREQSTEEELEVQGTHWTKNNTNSR